MENIYIKDTQLKPIYDDDYQGCFVCGRGNSRGLGLKFSYDRDTNEAYTKFIFPEYMQGYKKIIHGGFLFMLLDEVMAKACLFNEIQANFNFRYFTIKIHGYYDYFTFGLWASFNL